MEKLFTFLDSPLFDLVVKGGVLYFAILWAALIIWVARDIIHRSESLLVQIGFILLNLALPVFGLILYLILRPQKTLLEKYYEDMEHQFLTDQTLEKEGCPKCDAPVHEDYQYCPACGEKMKKRCSHCKHSYPLTFQVCPYCGKMRDKKKNEKEADL